MPRHSLPEVPGQGLMGRVRVRVGQVDWGSVYEAPVIGGAISTAANIIADRWWTVRDGARRALLSRSERNDERFGRDP